MEKSLQYVSQKLNINITQVETILNLLNEGSTVPFIARYRKEMTGGLDVEIIEQVNNIYKYNSELNERKEAIKKILNEEGLSTKELESKINSCEKKSELESIYEPFKVGKKTKASEAKALGLEPLANTIMETDYSSFNPFNEARKYLSEKVIDVDFAIEQAKLIIAQKISIDLETRDYVYNQIKNYGFIQTNVKKDGEENDEKSIFEKYYSHKEKLSKIANHRTMAIFRAENLKIISVSLNYHKKKIEYDLNNKYFKVPTSGKIIRDSLLDSLDRLIYPSIERKVKNDIFADAEIAAIKLFSENLEQMLLAPAVQGKKILSIDPAFVSGCKYAILSENGDVIDIGIIYPHKSKREKEDAKKIILELINKNNINIIVIGNGTASRETELFVANTLKENSLKIPFAIVSESGASVYSASKIAIEEFPELSVEQRSAINIGRKFQDPLNELVKIDPKAIGVGQYQHDVNQNDLSKALDFKTSKVVNNVGVDVNSATKIILSYVAGLSLKMASSIIEYRSENGLFKNRKEIKEVNGIGPKAFEQAIGFLRIHNSDEVLDKTQVHPESYELAKAIIKELDIHFDESDSEKIKNVNKEDLIEKFKTNEYDLNLILDSLLEPGKDIRLEKEGLILKTDVLEFKDLKEGMEMEGTVQNITDFGAFIYIGIKQSALIHISNLSDEFVSHPSEIVQTGQRVSIQIISIDDERKRIQARLIK